MFGTEPTKIPPGRKEPSGVGDDVLREADVLQQLAGDHGVEARIGEWKGLFDIRHDRLDTQLRRGLERHPIDVEPDDLVAVEKVPSDRAAPDSRDRGSASPARRGRA